MKSSPKTETAHLRPAKGTQNVQGVIVLSPQLVCGIPAGTDPLQYPFRGIKQPS